jgi:hypothetical protein
VTLEEQAVKAIKEWENCEWVTILSVEYGLWEVFPAKGCMCLSCEDEKPGWKFDYDSNYGDGSYFLAEDGSEGWR